MKITQPLMITFLLVFTTRGIFAQETITVVPTKGTLPLDPQAAEWQSIPAKEVAMAPQQMAMPMLAKGSIDKLTVQSLTDGKSIAWRVAWADATPDVNVDVARFSDAVAIEFPLTKDAAAMMGHKGGGKVQIIYWKGLWQKDLEEGFQDVQKVHPNYWSDLYWFADGKFPYPVPDAFKNPVSHQWFVAYKAGNPISVFTHEQPAQELVAEGWGSLTAQTESVTKAKGVWTDGRWQVVFLRPLTTADPNDYQFSDQGQVAFAVWQGGDGNVGGRKHWSNNWVAYQIPK